MEKAIYLMEKMYLNGGRKESFMALGKDRVMVAPMNVEQIERFYKEGFQIICGKHPGLPKLDNVNLEIICGLPPSSEFIDKLEKIGVQVGYE